MKTTKIKENSNYMRDDDSGAVVSIDNKALYAYKAKRRKNKEVEDRLNRIEDTLELILTKL